MRIGQRPLNPFDDAFDKLQATTPLEGPIIGGHIQPISQSDAKADAKTDMSGGDNQESPIGRVHPGFFTSSENNIKNPVLRGLAKAGDIAGSILVPGATAMIPGTRLNEQALENREAGLESEQAKTEHERAATKQTEAQTEMMGQSVPVQTADGRTIFIPKKEFAKYEEGMNTVTGRQNVAETQIQGKKDIEAMKEEIAKGNVTRQLFDPQTQETVFYNKQGNEVKRVKGQYNASSWLPKSTSTTQYMQDADGNIVEVPKTTTSTPVVPQGGNTTSPAQTPHVSNRNTHHLLAHGGTQAHAVLGENGQPLQGKGAHEEQAKVQAINDTAGAFEQYQSHFDSLSDKLTPNDRDALRILINQNPPTSGFVESLPIAGPVAEAVNGLISGTITSDQYKSLSPAAQTLFTDYYNALAHHFAFLKQSQGSIGRNPQMIQAEMHTVPLPYVERRMADEALTNYRKRISGQQKAFGSHNTDSGKPGDPLGIL